MPRYALKRGGKAVREEEEGEEIEDEVVGEMKSVLEEAMQDAWRRPEARAMKKKLSNVAKKWWKPQIEEAIKTTKYDKELEARAREIDYSGKVKKVWE